MSGLSINTVMFIFGSACQYNRAESGYKPVTTHTASEHLNYYLKEPGLPACVVIELLTSSHLSVRRTESVTVVLLISKCVAVVRQNSMGKNYKLNKKICSRYELRQGCFPPKVKVFIGHLTI